MTKITTNDKKEDKKKHGFRYCSICGNKLSKDGFDARGKQRYYCSTCKTSKRLKDDRQSQEKLIRIVSTILLKGITAELACKIYGFSRFILFRMKQKFRKIWPEIASTGEVYPAVLVDGTRIKKQYLFNRQDSTICNLLFICRTRKCRDL